MRKDEADEVDEVDYIPREHSWSSSASEEVEFTITSSRREDPGRHGGFAFCNLETRQDLSERSLDSGRE